jgi:hypothetical protein
MILVGILGSQSRNGFLGAMVALTLTIAISRPRLAQFGAALLALMVLSALTLQLAGGDIPFYPRLKTLIGIDPYAERCRIWRDAVDAWLAYPLLGTGFGTFSAAAAPYFRRPSGVHYGHAENEYLEWLVEGGVVAAALVLTGLVALTVLASRAAAWATAADDRSFVLGASIGGITILTESTADFALHIPGVAVTVVILCSHLCKLGLESSGPSVHAAEPCQARSVLGVANLAAFPCLALVILFQGIGLTRSEAAFRAAESARVEPSSRTGAAELRTRESLRRVRAALDSALTFRPNWAEGHQQLGLTLIKLYELETTEELCQSIADPEERAQVASVLWLHARVHANPLGGASWDNLLLASRTVRSYLIPATREFLEARRCCPVLSIPYAKLASLDFLLKGGKSSAVMNARAFQLAGSHADVISLCGQLALQGDDPELLSLVLNRRLKNSIGRWEEVAEQASLFFSPEYIFSRIVSSGREAVLFAGYLYPSAEDRATRDQLLHAAIEQLRSDQESGAAECAYWEAKAWSLRGDRGRAERAILQALGLKPRQASWRRELVEWYLDWGRLQEAHEQALIGLQLTPLNGESRQAWALSFDALADGQQHSGSSSGSVEPRLDTPR